MKNFKLFRTGSLTLGLWLFISAVYVIISGYEKSICCAFEIKGYRVYTLVQWLIDAKNESLLGACNCDLKNLPTSYYIVPIDLIVGSLVFLGIFAYLQFFKSNVKKHY